MAPPQSLNGRQALSAYTGAFLDELVRAGVRHLCLCPGSRSTPLALMAASHPGLRVWTHIDERSASFFALGMARLLRQPVALLSTSGTAAANFLPAVVEARYARVPLVVLTADRPPELREVGAAQTIDQLRLFGPFPKWFAEMPLPEPTDELPQLLRFARQAAGRAVAVAAGEPAGPVHLNFPFREPLVPQPPWSADTFLADGRPRPDWLPDPALGAGADAEGSLPAPAGTSAAAVSGIPGAALPWQGRPQGQPYVKAWRGRRTPAPELVHQLARRLAAAPRGLLVLGPQDDPALAGPVATLAELLGYPVLADPLSQVRCGPHASPLILDAYDAFLREPALAGALAPQLVLRLGAVPTSKPLNQFLVQHGGVPTILIDGGEGWRDPDCLASDVIHADPGLVLAELAGAVRELGAQPDPAWLAAWQAADRSARQALADGLAEQAEPFEGRVFAELAELLPAGCTVYVGNSMPVRDLDAFYPASPRPVRFVANRGANGIDGVVSSALGASAVAPGPVVLCIGDLSFFHDLNGLWAARRHGLSLTVVLLNNDGGGIFSFLPQAQVGEHFETLFGTPLGIDFRPAVEMYGGRFVQADSWEAFREGVRRGLAEGGLQVVQVRTTRAENVVRHGQLWAAARQAALRAVQEVLTLDRSRQRALGGEGAP